MSRNVYSLSALSLSLFLIGCEESPVQITEQIRAVKTITVSDIAGGAVRKFSGNTIAANSASLSFPVPGTVQDVKVSTGDKITKNQILAVLDDASYRLDVQAAEADLRKSKSNSREKEEEYNRSKQLFDKGWVSKANIDEASYAMASAQSDVQYKTVQLNQAKRALNDTILTAPYDGVISLRSVEPNEEVSSGKEILALDAAGTLEISISTSETVIAMVTMGMPATVTFSALLGDTIQGRVTEISHVANVGNVFPVKISLIDPPENLRAGMSGEVSLVTKTGAAQEGYLIPVSALAPGSGDNEQFVFILDMSTKTLTKRSVQFATIRANLIAVKGIDAGDLVVTAGVTFLRDGQKVKLLSDAAQ